MKKLIMNFVHFLCRLIDRHKKIKQLVNYIKNTEVDFQDEESFKEYCDELNNIISELDTIIRGDK